jgi:site-specific recombinase XerD
MSTTNSLPQLLHYFFHDWMAAQRNASRHTIVSYRDSWRLFLRFVAERRQRNVARLGLADLTAEEVVAFLDYIEKDRGGTIATRNCRLAALHSFFRFVAGRDPLTLKQCESVLCVPVKRGPKRSPNYLETEEVATLLTLPDRQSVLGQRDYALLVLLYNTGARISEALTLCPRDIRLETPAQIRLLGKGRKERICPLWPETAALLNALLKRQPRQPDEPIFLNRYGQPLSASGARFRLQQYVRVAAKQTPRIGDKRVTPHTWRHTAAVHLIAAKVDPAVIRSWLGHSSLDTTNLYAQANLETKRKAIEQVDKTTRPTKPPRWKRDRDLLAWLDSL